ncbi:hypothetical protein EGW08_023619 [Elysia chlorotica]|uniref:Fibrinogen C-terminal domain-containing protein n=1 Tax=Elysia chlorotica TaxID=188477 RepID=A0A3S0Z3P1_ELYCH|nr:hypothetical protein EGW08_023619 [Elysia chlorotica]
MPRSWTLSPLVLLLLRFSCLCSGLHFDVDFDPLVQPGSRAACAVIRCVEENPISSTDSFGQSQQSSLGLKNISRLTIFQSSAPSSQGKADSGQEVVVASVTSQHPRVTRVSNGVMVTGALEAGQASITLELVKPTDCDADYRCELRSMDVSGVETVSSTRVMHSRRRREGDASDSLTISTPISLQILQLGYDTNAKLSASSLILDRLSGDLNLLGNKMAKIESSLKSMESIFNTKLDMLGKTTELVVSKVDALEDKILSVQTDLHQDLDLLQNRIEDRMEESLGDKLADVHLKIATFITKAESHSDNLNKSLNESVTKLGNYLKDEQKEALTKLTYATKVLLDSQSNATDVLVTSARNLTQERQIWRTNLQADVAEAARDMRESSVNISRTLAVDVAALGHDLQSSLQQFASGINQSAIHTLSSANRLFLQTNSTAAAVVKDLLSPARCYKGLVTALSHVSYPYPLIQPRDGKILDVPHLCDTVTDGGGWIIIQRRSTGDVDFQRGWDDYKNGFGDLSRDFWLGNRHIHKLTSTESYELRVELFFQGKSAYARYGTFIMADEANNFSLDVGNYSGTAGDSLVKNGLGKQFTTIDRDNDNDSRQCADVCQGGWWYHKCGASGLNGKWQEDGFRGSWWFTFSDRRSVSFAEMKIRRLRTS